MSLLMSAFLGFLALTGEQRLPRCDCCVAAALRAALLCCTMQCAVYAVLDQLDCQLVLVTCFALCLLWLRLMASVLMLSVVVVAACSCAGNVLCDAQLVHVARAHTQEGHGT